MGASGCRAKRSDTICIRQIRRRSARTSCQGTKIGAWPTRNSHISETCSPIGPATRLTQPL